MGVDTSSSSQASTSRVLIQTSSFHLENSQLTLWAITFENLAFASDSGKLPSLQKIPRQSLKGFCLPSTEVFLFQ